MKTIKIFLVCYILLSVFNVKAQTNQNNAINIRVLKGTIKCNKSEWAVFTYWGQKMINTDSVFLKKGINNVTFRGLKASLNDEDTYSLTIKKDHTQPFFIFSSDTIHIKMDLTDRKKYKKDFGTEKLVLNSPATIEYYSIYNELGEKVYDIERKLKTEKDSLIYNNLTSARLTEINKELSTLKKNYFDILIDRALNCVYSCNSGMALYFLTDELSDVKNYLWIADSVEKRFPKSLYIKRQVEGMRAKNKRYNSIATFGMAKNFELKQDNNKVIKLSDFRGNYVLLDFWASWCVPCVKEIPHNIELQKKYADKGFKIITISIDKKRDDWLYAIKKHNMQDFINLHDNDKKVAQMYNLSYVPLTILIDPKGEIIGSNLRGQDLDRKLKSIFKE